MVVRAAPTRENDCRSHQPADALLPGSCRARTTLVPSLGNVTKMRAANFGFPAVLLVGAAVVMAGGFRAPGSEFDEGRLVALPVRILHGAVPYRDFESFYGPANTYVVAAVFKLFGPSLEGERAIGLVVRLLAMLAIFWLGRRFGLVSGLVAGSIAALLLCGEIGAGADPEALALALIALALTVLSAETRARPSSLAFAGGLLGGIAALFRLEILPAVLLGALVLLLPRTRSLVSYACGLLFGLLPYVAVAVVVGYGRLRLNYHDLVATGRDRRLPIPGPHSEAGRILLVSLCATALVLGVGVWRTARTGDPHSRLLLGLGLFAAAQAPFAFWRADAPHILIAGLVPLAFLPCALAKALDRGGSWQGLVVAGSAGLLLALFLLSTTSVRANIATEMRALAGRRVGYDVSYDGRSFIIASRPASIDLQRVVSFLGAEAHPGQRLFVGPSDLRRTNYNDVFLYYLLPWLKPASFYVEVDPFLSNPGSSLPADLERSDYLVLSSRWNGHLEDNASRRLGSPVPNQIVRSLFCVQRRFGTYVVDRRCR